jgi:hypothetical protein
MTKLETLMGTAEGQSRYIDWLSQEITQSLLQELRERIRPKLEAEATRELGRLSGLQEAIDILTHYRGARTQQGGAGLPSADYGARETEQE